MKWVALWISLNLPIGEIAQINELREKAKAAWDRQDFTESARIYAYLVDTVYAPDPQGRMRMNLAHAYLQAKDTTNALAQYQEISQRIDKGPIPAEALNQIGQLVFHKGKRRHALNLFKRSLKADPSYEEARYNYQLVKKSLEQNPESSTDSENPDSSQDSEKNQEQQKQQNKENAQESSDPSQKEENNPTQQEEQNASQEEEKDGNKESASSEENRENKNPSDKEDQSNSQTQEESNPTNPDSEEPTPTVSDRLKEIQMSEERAKMILEALRHSEIQYLQQIKRKPTRRPNPKRPDW
ncbi:MAG: tetratricopeptide repeat protein [Cytophagales bacterium]|nr:tetratricopeptide repeat protein [Cytophagales bacterium]